MSLLRNGPQHHRLCLVNSHRQKRRFCCLASDKSKPDKTSKADSTDELLKAGVGVVGDLAKTYLAADPRWKVLGSVAEKFIDTGPSSASGKVSNRSTSDDVHDQTSGVYTLIAALVAIYVLKNDFGQVLFKSMYLHHTQPRYFQFLSSSLCALSWVQLSTASFFLYVFGRIVERNFGWFGVWGAYLTCGAGASFARYMLLPVKIGKVAVTSTGAVSAAFGIFLATILMRPSLSWRRAIETLLVGQFVVRVALADATQPLAMQMVNILGHKLPAQCADLIGAAAGSALFCAMAFAVTEVIRMSNKKGQHE